MREIYSPLRQSEETDRKKTTQVWDTLIFQETKTDITIKLIVCKKRLFVV